jgi:3-phenylpropionate/trans-cinnamate dioxygenase ferredoxin component
MALQKVADIAKIPDGCARAVDAGGQPVAVVHVADGVVKAIHNICSHQYYELAPEGVTEEARSNVRCTGRSSISTRGRP